MEVIMSKTGAHVLSVALLSWTISFWPIFCTLFAALLPAGAGLEFCYESACGRMCERCCDAAAACCGSAGGRGAVQAGVSSRSVVSVVV